MDNDDYNNGLPGKPMAFIMLISVLLVAGIAGYGLLIFLHYILILFGVAV